MNLDERSWASVDAAIAATIQGDTALLGSGEAEHHLAATSTPASHEDSRVTWQLTVAYHGDSFSGYAWQRAPVKPTVEETLQRAILPLTDGRSELRLACAGRTDAGEI